MQLVLSRPFHPSNVRETFASCPVTLFILMVSGFVTGELCTEWKTAQHIFLWIPERFAASTDLSSIGGWIEGIWMIFVYPALLWLLFGAINGDISIIRNWRFLALPLVVIVSAGHMAKGLAKLVSWAGFLPGAVRDTSGVDTIIGISSKDIPIPSSVMPLSIVSFISIALVIAGMYIPYREERLTNPVNYYRTRVPVLLLGIFFIVIIAGWK